MQLSQKFAPLRGGPRLTALGLVALGLSASPVAAQIVNFQGSTTGAFNGGSQATTAILNGSAGGVLTFNFGTFNEDTSSGILALSSGQLGTFQLTGPASGDSSFNGSFTFVTTFIAPPGSNPPNSTISAPVTGSVTGTINGGVLINFTTPAQLFSYNGGTFTYQVNPVSVNNGAPAQPISAFITATGPSPSPAPEPPGWMVVPGLGVLFGMTILRARRRKAQAL